MLDPEFVADANRLGWARSDEPVPRLVLRLWHAYLTTPVWKIRRRRQLRRWRDELTAEIRRVASEPGGEEGSE